MGAKLSLLRLVYDCLDKYLAREDYAILSCDTDSVYISTSAPDGNIDHLVKQDLRSEYFREYKHWFPSPACDRHYPEFAHSKSNQQSFNGDRPCCKRRYLEDQR